MKEKQDILKRAIQLATDNGWKPTWVGYENGYFKDEKHHFPLVWTAMREPYLSFKWESLVFNHDFAKALWPDDPKNFPQSEENSNGYEQLGLYTGGGYEGYGDFVRFEGDLWQFHIQQMVIADDPIQYLGENI